MAGKVDRLKRLVRLQKQIASLHEVRHAQHLANAAEAQRETVELLDALNAGTPMPGLFPDLYNRKIATSIDRQHASADLARQEAARVATASARTNMVTRAYEEAFRLEERSRADKEQLEQVERGRAKPK